METIGHLMRSPLVSIGSQEMVSAAILSFHLNRVDALLVKVSDQYVGILVKSELMRRIKRGELDPYTTLIYEVMNQPIPCLDRNQSMLEANRFMSNHNLRYLAVTEGNRVIGLLSADDLIADFMDRYL